MGSIIGQTYPVGENFAPDKESGRTVEVALQDIVDFHAEWISPLLAEYPREAEADILLVLDEQSTVLDVQILRVKTDDDKDGRIFGNTEGKAIQWVKSIVDYAHTVEGMRTYWVLHRHPNTNPNPSDRDERLGNVVGALDFLFVGGHPGADRHYSGMSVFTDTTTLPCEDSTDHSGVMEIDVLIAESLADAYEDAFDDSDIATAQREIADALRELYDNSNGKLPGPMEQMEFKFKVEFPALMKQAAAAMAIGEEAFRDALTESWARMLANGELRDRYLEASTMDDYEAPRPIGFGTPESVAEAVIEALAESDEVEEVTEEEPTLHPAVLADLAAFDFSQLDT